MNGVEKNIKFVNSKYYSDEIKSTFLSRIIALSTLFLYKKQGKHPRRKMEKN